MDREIKKLNDIFVNLFNTVLRLEEEAIQNASYGDISITEVHTLEAVGTGRPKTMTHIANILGIKVSTLTTAINRLVKKGYAQRLRDENDRRIVKVSLTERGMDAVKEHEDFHESMIREAIAQIPEESIRQFVSSVDNINNFLVMRSSMAYKKDTSFELAPMELAGNHLPVPIVQAGMSIGVAGSSLVSAVAIEGGLGLIGTSEIGYGTNDYEENPLKANLSAIEKTVSEARNMVKKAKGKGLVGASIMWNNPNAGEYVKAAIRGGAQVIVTSAGVPKNLPEYCSDRKIALMPTISSKKSSFRHNKSLDSEIQQNS